MATLLGVFVVACSGRTPSIDGLWNATVVVDEVEVPFRMEFSGGGTNARGSFFNGDEKVSSTSGRFDGDTLDLNFDHYATRLHASFKDGVLDGRYELSSNRPPYPFHAKRFAAAPVPDGDVPSIAGLWTMPVKSPKGESAWRLIVRQAGPEVSAAILRVDGDTGALSGTYRNGRFVLSHFSGARPLLLELTLAKDGTLDVVRRPRPPQAKEEQNLVATRSDEARARGLPEPADPSRFTSVKDPTKPLRFSFRDLEGHVVAETDPRFQGKVVLEVITGSWCPNCHDEAPFLSQLYRKYRQRGLQIVAFAFEQAEQLENPTRLRAFIERYEIEYPVLLAGLPGELNEKLPEAVNLNSFPTTFLVGRDGLVRGVHAGFPSAASGSFYGQAKEELTANIERLLSEPVPALP